MQTVLSGGADTFVFGARDGLDRIMDFRSADGDVIRFLDPRLDWSDLDSDGNGTLEGADRLVAVVDGGIVIDHGAAPGAGDPSRHRLTGAGATGLTAADFLFV